MKKTLSMICAALMFSAPLASFAQPGPPQSGQQGQQQGRPQQGQPQSRPQQGQQGQQQGRPQQGQPQSHPQQGQHQGNQQHYNGPGNNQAYRDPSYRPQPGMPVPHSQWRPGHVVDQGYRGDRYWVTDWQARHLPAPPHNHRWLRINGDYVMVAIASGVIMNILTGY